MPLLALNFGAPIIAVWRESAKAKSYNTGHKATIILFYPAYDIAITWQQMHSILVPGVQSHCRRVSPYNIQALAW